MLDFLAIGNEKRGTSGKRIEGDGALSGLFNELGSIESEEE
ncbi:MAG TPA: hypothetical protein VGM92_02895 [Candidatus Kapabacteria bacterium]